MGLMDGFNEGDYIRTTEGLFFAVKGSRHPEGKVVGVLRYMPDPEGERVIEGERYRRVYDLGASTAFLRNSYPIYVSRVERLGLEMQSVPVKSITRHYDPRKRLLEILKAPGTVLENVLAEFVTSISRESDIPFGSFGVSGSLLIGAQREDSDIDINLYGDKASQRAYTALKTMREEQEWVTPLQGDVFSKVLVSRWGDTGLPLDSFSGIESRKILHGLVRRREYFVRLLIPDDNLVSRPIKKATIRATISDASSSIYNPCTYQLDQFEHESIWDIRELKSYRGKFTEQAVECEWVEARGTVEEVQGPTGVYHRIMMADKGDYLLPVKDN